MTRTWLPELAEDRADSETAGIYAEIRRCPGISEVNLVFRHLACLQGVLAPVWSIVRPAYEQGWVHEVADEQLAPVGQRDRADGASEELRLRIGLGPSEREQVLHRLDQFAVANRLNLVGLSLMRAAAGSEVAPTSTEAWASDGGGCGSVAGPVVRGEEVPPVGPATRTPEMVELCGELTGERESTTSQVIIPSVLSYLAQWPTLIVAAASACRGLGEAAIRLDADDLALRARRAAEAIPVQEAADDLDAHQRHQLVAAVDRFERLIPRMLVVGEVVRGLLDGVPDELTWTGG